MGRRNPAEWGRREVARKEGNTGGKDFKLKDTRTQLYTSSHGKCKPGIKTPITSTQKYRKPNHCQTSSTKPLSPNAGLKQSSTEGVRTREAFRGWAKEDGRADMNFQKGLPKQIAKRSLYRWRWDGSPKLRGRAPYTGAPWSRNSRNLVD